MPEVTFVALHALPAIDSTVPGVFGGTETRAWTFARALARLPGWKVNFAVRPKSPQLEYDDVHIVRLRNPLYEVRIHVAQHIDLYYRFPFFQLKRWSWHLLWELPLLLMTRPFRRRNDQCWSSPPDFMQLPGDLLLTFGVHIDSARTVAAGHATGRSVIVFLGADSDLDERYVTNPDYVDPYGNRAPICLRVLQEADAIVVQTQRQARLLTERYGREGTTIPNPIDDCVWDAQAQHPLPSELRHLEQTGYVLWIGRADRFHKRPLLCLQLALRFPEIPFLMVLNPRDVDVEEEVMQRRPGNLHVISQIPFNQMAILFHHARVFLNTSSSEMEGFPNAFLQAAISRVPICSLEFGTEFLNTYAAGSCVTGSLDALAETVNHQWMHPPTAEQLKQTRDAVLADYGVEPQVTRLIELLKRFCCD